MAETGNTQRPRQQAFREMVLGTLVYAVVLGFFEDYTEILSTWSYTTTFLVAIVLQLLTYATLWLKSLVVRHFRGKEGRKSFALMAFVVWLIMFSSKFVFRQLGRHHRIHRTDVHHRHDDHREESDRHRLRSPGLDPASASRRALCSAAHDVSETGTFSSGCTYDQWLWTIRQRPSTRA